MLLLSLVPSTLWAFRFVPGYPRWKFESMPITFHITYSEVDNWAGRSKEQVKALVQSAFDMWAQATCHSVVFKIGSITKAGAGEEDGKNVITWVAGLPGVS